MKSESIFIDTGAWYALVDMDDAHHKDALSIYPELLNTYRVLVTSNLVVAEAYVLILNEIGHPTAVGFLERIHTSPRITKVYSTEDIEKDAEDTLRKYTDQDFSYADSVSFTIMKRQKIRKAFSFDKHFQTIGFITLP